MQSELFEPTSQVSHTEPLRPLSIGGKIMKVDARAQRRIPSEVEARSEFLDTGRLPGTDLVGMRKPRCPLYLIARTILQGFPTASTSPGRLRETTLPAPTIVREPIVTPGRIGPDRNGGTILLLAPKSSIERVKRR
jgi:hypothetical protein